MALGVYGKHSARGDFLEHGLPEALRTALEGWLDVTLSDARDHLGAEWDPLWAAAPALRFWLGEAVWGRQVSGVMIPSQDRVGRRFPLVLLALDSGLPPPSLSPDQTWHTRVERHLASLLVQPDLASPASVIEGIEDPAAPASVDSADFWAVREGDGIATLWADVAATDHRRAATGRSYWWVAPAGDAADGEQSVPEGGQDRPVVAGGETHDTAFRQRDPADADGGEAAEQAALPAETPGTDTAEGTSAPSTCAPDAPLPALAAVPEQDDSPFAAPTDGLDLFAAPIPAAATAEIITAAPQEAALQSFAPARPRTAYSQVWAGPGLPTGQVIAWLLGGFHQNG